MFTVVAFCESHDPAAAFLNVAGVVDQHVTVNGDNIYVPVLNKIVGILASTGATVPGTPYLDAPSLRGVALFDIQPVSGGIVGVGPDLQKHIPMQPLELSVSEGMKIADNSNPGSAEYHTFGILLADKAITPVKSAFVSVRTSASITGVNGAWANGALTFSQVLPVGRYAVIGACCAAANAVLFRLVPVGEAHRPGGAVKTALTVADPSWMRGGNMGSWFEFHSTTPPSLDLLGVDTCTSQAVYLDLVYLG